MRAICIKYVFFCEYIYKKTKIMKTRIMKKFNEFFNESKLPEGISPSSEEAGKMLRLACSEGKLEEIKSLVEQGVDPALRRLMPVKWTVDFNHPECFEYLLNAIGDKLTPQMIEDIEEHWIKPVLTMNKTGHMVKFLKILSKFKNL